MSTPTPPKNIRYPRITALIAIILAAVNLRSVITAISPLIPEIQASTGMSGTMVGIIGTVPTAMFAVSAFVLPRIKERFTLSEMMLLALGLTAVGQLLRVVYPNEWLLLVGSLIALFAIGILNATMPLVVREYFPRHVPSMSLTFMMSSQIMLAAAPIVAVPMMDWAENMGLPGWQISLGSWGVLAAIAAVSWMPLLIRRGPNPINTAPEPNFRLPVWRTTIGVGLAFMFGSNSLVAYTMMTFIPQIFTDAGQTAQYGANMLAIFSALGIPVTIVGPWLAGRLANVFPVVIMSAVFFSAALLGLAFAPLAAPWLWVTLAAVGTVIFPMGMVLVNIRARTLEGATALTSFGQGVGYTFASLGPLLTGAAHEATDSFFIPLTVMAAIGLVTLVAGYFASHQTYVEDQLPA
ncbi:TPA: MFS transporter [Corynebacterium striatum]|nr:MFS transporter [Corynebacterium striatum]HAT1506627.1 MFS transporter [Corynebacterium striatum]